ncbi:uncharacterized protein LOC130717631 isoform X2 [Lotus japonicus]|uniref:uncharacterized protein LOC130717631 isoform X2 n=1 Tax=Lotus japonicus TaxID=34305 RepID=UPI002587716A|nr:uncharacterized protein LOC130717631 isoform X2 [Lotus japonicus]
MGCFLACFGLSNKRKRRKTLYNVLAGGHQKYGNYEVLATTEKSIIPYSGVRDKRKEQNGVKSKKKKKVTFNLNVQIYEPDPTAYQVLNNEEEEENKNTKAESEGKSSTSSILGEESADLGMRYPSNYRYYNCRDNYDEEEDEITYEESDIDLSDDDEFDDSWSEQSLENDEAEVYDKNSEQNQRPLAPNGADVKSDSSGRGRSINTHSVLIPVENLTQWKAIKAKVASSKHRSKENVPLEQKTSLNLSPCSLESNALQSKPLLQEIAVDASLSNWLIAPNNHVPKATIHCQ